MLVLMIISKKNYVCKAVSTATKLNTMMMRHMGRKALTTCFSERTKYRKHLRIFGEIAVVANHERKSTRTKIKQREK